MNSRSIRFRLTAWYTLLFFITSGLVFTGFYYVTRQVLLVQTDSEITRHAESLVSNMDNSEEADIDSHELSQMPGMYVHIARPDEPGVADFSIPFPQFREQNIGSQPMRIGVFPVHHDGQVIRLVLMGHPLLVIENSLNRLVGILFGALIVVGGLSWLVGLIISDQALKPISQLSAKLKLMSSANLKEQLQNPGTGDELEDLSVSFNSLMDSLASSFSREKQFIGDVAHELKTPLAILKNTIEVVLSRKRTVRVYRQALADTLTDVDNLSATVSDVLDLAWSQSDEIVKNLKVVDLSTMLTELEELARTQSQSRRITVISEIQSGVQVRAVAPKLFRALLNIVDNALKYTPVSGRIVISLSKTGSRAELEVSNTGPGIPKGDLPHIFERFYRGTREVEGTGLGLPITKSIIEAHSGQIRVASIPGKITTVNISLPAS